MSDPAIIEAAARAAYEHGAHPVAYAWDNADEAEREHARSFGQAILAAVTPLILEEAAQVAEEFPCSASSALPGTGDQIAAAIRALKEQAPESSAA
jgi:hypothetical protein